MARKVKSKETVEETGSQVVRSTGEEITVVTKTGKKVTYIKNRTTSVETVTPEVKVETKEKEVKEKDRIINIMEEEDDGFDHINANINEGLNDEQVIHRIK